MEVAGRPIGIFRHKENVYALDHHCYHAGGPLSDARDIEDLIITNKQGESVLHSCVVCPWHKYRISLTTGEGLYIHVDPFSQRKVEPQVKSRGFKQRTHKVWEENGRVYVRVNNQNEQKFESDYYASEEFQLRVRR